MEYLKDAQINSPLSFQGVIILVVISSAIGLIWAILNFIHITKINIKNGTQGQYEQSNQQLTDNQINLLIELGDKISEGAKQFLKQQYTVCLVFVFIMFFIIFGAVERGKTAYTSFAFAIGAITSMLCGAIGMSIATMTNYRVTFFAKNGLAQAFRIAYRGGCVMGFALVSIALLILLLLIIIYKSLMGNGDFRTFIPGSLSLDNGYYKLFQAIAGYGLGGSTVALFGRVGGGIYTKAADVGADLVGKIQKDLPQDSPKNPATIADNVGDNVGDIAGMGADLFGSFAQATCAALVISSNTLCADLQQSQIWLQNLMFPLTLMAIGILVCLITSVVGIVMNVDTDKKIQDTLKIQIILSTLLLCGGLYLAAYLSLPSSFYLDPISSGIPSVRHPYHAYLCSLFGLISGMIIGTFTEYMTSHSYNPVRQLANNCRTGAATNVIYGLALGYLSTIVPVVCIAATAFGANQLLGYYGIALAALGMLSNLSIGLAIDAYGPISDNAGGIAQMSQMGQQVRARTDALDAAGNTTAAIGKGFAIGSAALVALSLYGGFLHNSNLIKVGTQVELGDPYVLFGLVLGATLPYAFTAFTMKSVGRAALGMVEQIRRQIQQNPGILDGSSEPDFRACIRISTQASIKQMIAPGSLVIFTPLILGISFGPKVIAGFLPGAIVAGVQLAISAANTGGAWDNAKKYIQAGNLTDSQGNQIRKGSDVHKAAVVGDTVGDPLKDTSGPSLNILIKLMAILSLVFASLFLSIHPK